VQVGNPPRADGSRLLSILAANRRRASPTPLRVGGGGCLRRLLRRTGRLLLPPAEQVRRPHGNPASSRDGQEQSEAARELGERLRIRVSRLEAGQGAVAQLGERHAGSVEVTGSNPVGSISPDQQGAVPPAGQRNGIVP